MKTRKILGGLGGNISIRSLAQFSSANGVLVSAHVSRVRGKFALPPQVLGLIPAEWSTAAAQAFSESVKLGRLMMIPKEREQELNRIEGCLRRLVDEMTLNGTYLPVARYDEFSKGFLALQAQYTDAIEKIAEDWDSLTAAFVANVQSLVADRCPDLPQDKKESLVAFVSAQVPSADEYRQKGTMDIEIRPFPGTPPAESNVPPELQAQLNGTWKDDVVSNAVAAIRDPIQKCFDVCSAAVCCYARSGKLQDRSIKPIVEMCDQLKKDNLFNNLLISKLGTRLSAVHLGMDAKAVDAIVEDAILDIWEYTQEVGMEISTDKCPFSKEDLTKMVADRP